MIELNERKLKSFEVYHDERINTPLIIRLDGNNFQKLITVCDFEKPFDKNFHEMMIKTARKILTKTSFRASLVHVASDELSFFFSKDFCLPYKGRVEKLISLLAAYTTSCFQTNLIKKIDYREPISFDARIVRMKDLEEAFEYYCWRAFNTYRNFLNSYAQVYLKRNEALGKRGKELISKLRTKDIFIEKLPSWQKYGTFLFWEAKKKEVIDKIKLLKVIVLKRKLKVRSINLGSKDGKELLKNLIFSSIGGN
ncbi:MAG: tRNA(His) guanylyltransferase Thg1 family protein [Candidatus Bathyarchaeia archaeon]